MNPLNSGQDPPTDPTIWVRRGTNFDPPAGLQAPQGHATGGQPPVAGNAYPAPTDAHRAPTGALARWRIIALVALVVVVAEAIWLAVLLF
jgi:hypothetical protein